MQSLAFIPPAVVAFWGVVIILLQVFVNVVFAFGVYSDALELRRGMRTTKLVNPAIWLFATLIGGVFVAAVYWILHHSTLNPFNTSRSKEPNDESIL